jgi:hypothetical protein
MSIRGEGSPHGPPRRVGLIGSSSPGRINPYGYIIGVCCFCSKHASIRSKSKDWLDRNQNNVSDGLTRILTSLTTQTDLSWTDRWSPYYIPFETLMSKGITKYMSDRGYSRNFYSSCNDTHEISLKVDYWRWTTVQLITYAYTQTCANRLGYAYWWLFINLYKWKTMNNSWWIKV